MRVARLIGVILTILSASLAGELLLAPAAGARPPFRLASYVTDSVGVLSASDRAEATSAVDRLYTNHHVRLWVVYVDDFGDLTPENWAKRAYASSDLGAYDALLAVSISSRAYAFLVPNAVRTVNASEVDNLRRTQIEPALRDGNWTGAAVAAANGLDKSPNSSGRVVLLSVLGGIVVVVAVLLIVMRYRNRRRRAAALAAARRIDPTDENALAAVPLDALDDLSRLMVVDVDNAVRTSSNELALALDEFGQERTEPFTGALDNAKAALSQAFTVRQQLDDDTPETPAQRREMLTRVIVSAARADRELESQTEAFEQLRDLLLNAPSRLDGLTQQYVELTARINPAEQHLIQLHDEFDAAALTSVSGNVSTAKERLAFADKNIGAARELTEHVESGKQNDLVDAVRAAESALGQARSLLDAVDSASHDIRHAVASLPSLMTEIETAITHASEQLQQSPSSKSAHTRELIAARDAATRTVDTARGTGSADPLGTFVRLTTADADLGRVLATVAEEKAAADRLNRSLEQALFTAESRVRGVSEYIDTRRGSIGSEARTRLAEAQRQLQAAYDTRATDVTDAIAHANSASTLAAHVQALANADVQSAQSAFSRRSGDDTGALIGGIIVSDLLRGGMGGGFGWSPTSFGGSSRNSSGGGFMGGGGRF
jgi:hypothetical protein